MSLATQAIAVLKKAGRAALVIVPIVLALLTGLFWLLGY